MSVDDLKRPILKRMKSRKNKNIDNSLAYRLRLIAAYKDIMRNHIPLVFRYYCQNFRNHQLAAMGRLREKWTEAEKGGAKIEVAFLITIPGMWKVDYLYKAMQIDPHYHPFAVIYPYSAFKGFEADEIAATVEKTRLFLEQKGVEYVIPVDDKGKWQDINKTIKPDIVFFSTPYKDVPTKYYIFNFKDTFTCYVPYGLTIMNTYRNNYDLIFHNLVGIYFLETSFNKRMSQLHSRIHGTNVEVSGFLPSEVFLRKDYSAENRWRPQSSVKKKVIWAPHHTIDAESQWSTFLLCCDAMIEIAEKYRDSIQFAFKPHQLLKFKLQQIWGEQKTDEYYAKWASMENTQLEESSYVDLFLTSDAMIHDSGSFTMEYLFTRKPVMYLARDISFKERFSDEGKKAFDCHYVGGRVEEIEKFLTDVVLRGEDPKSAVRETFYNNTLNTDSSCMPSERVLNILQDYIFDKTNNK